MRCRHVSEQEAHAFEVGDRMSELTALPGIVQRDVKGRLRQSDGARGDTQPAGVQRRKCDRETLAFSADEPVGVHIDVGKVQLPRRRTLEAHLVFGRACPQARAIRRHQEAADAARSLVGVRAITV